MGVLSAFRRTQGRWNLRSLIDVRGTKGPAETQSRPENTSAHVHIHTNAYIDIHGQRWSPSEVHDKYYF